MGRLVKIGQPVISSARRYYGRSGGPFRQQMLNTVIVSLYLMGVSVERLSGWYRPKQKRGGDAQPQD